MVLNCIDIGQCSWLKELDDFKILIQWAINVSPLIYHASRKLLWEKQLNMTILFDVDWDGDLAIAIFIFIEFTLRHFYDFFCRYFSTLFAATQENFQWRNEKRTDPFSAVRMFYWHKKHTQIPNTNIFSEFRSISITSSSGLQKQTRNSESIMLKTRVQWL